MKPITPLLKDFESLKVEMVRAYGAKAFDEGFPVVKQNQDIYFTSDYGSDYLISLTGHLFATEADVRAFLTRCTSYLLTE